MHLAIRAAEEADEVAVVALWRASDLVVPENDPVYDFHHARNGPCSEILVGEDEGGRIVGVAMVGHDGHRGYIHLVASDPSARGSGFGKRMVEAAEAWIRVRGMRRMHLMVRETNTQVMPFYEKLGFARMPYTVMSKWLTNV